MFHQAAKRFAGVIVPMVTPFTSAGEIDLAAVDRLVDHVIDGGVDGVFLLGTTGESASIPRVDKLCLVERAAKRLDGRATLYAGVSSSALAESLELAEAFASCGVDALVAHPPGYFPVTPVALEEHMRRLADGIGLPLLLYDIPKVTHCELEIESILRLAAHPRVAGLKDSTGNAARVATLIDRLSGRDDFALHLGSASLFGRFLSRGGRGVSGIVPSSANLEPQLYRDLMCAARRGDDDCVCALHARSESLGSVYQSNRTLGESLAMLKRQLSFRGLCGPFVLPPLMQTEGEA